MSFQLFYTGSELALTTQTHAPDSLGGFVSSSPIPNGSLGNLFDALSKYSQELGGSEVRAVALINTSNAAIASPLSLWFNYPSSGVTVFSLPAAEGQSYFLIDAEKIKLTIPVSAVDTQFQLLSQRISLGKMSVMDRLTATFTNGTTTQAVVVPLASFQMEGTNAVIEFNRDALTLTGSITLSLVNFSVTCENVTNNCKIEISPVSLVSNRMEAVADPRSNPYVGTFYECAGQLNALNLGSSFPSRDGVGLWIRRTILMPNPIDEIPCKDLKAYTDSLDKAEKISLKLEY